MTSEPLFTVCIPVWNRRDCLPRCLDSVARQRFEDYEVVAVDDGSDDSSADYLASIKDPRFRLVRHSSNKGVCAARATAVEHARGRWLVGLDTDWALKEDALEVLARAARELPPSVGVLGALAQSDTGETWPKKPAPQGPFGLREFIQWGDSDGPTDYLQCRRREVFREISWPRDRRLEARFHLLVASRWQLVILENVLAEVYTDAPNRWTTDGSARAVERTLEMAPFLADDLELILAEFGDVLRESAPRRYRLTLEMAAKYRFLAGSRARGLKHCLRLVAHDPLALQAVGLAVGGMLGPRPLIALSKASWARDVYRRAGWWSRRE